jgi:hypothetical protein
VVRGMMFVTGERQGKPKVDIRKVHPAHPRSRRFVLPSGRRCPGFPMEPKETRRVAAAWPRELQARRAAPPKPPCLPAGSIRLPRPRRRSRLDVEFPYRHYLSLVRVNQGQPRKPGQDRATVLTFSTDTIRFNPAWRQKNRGVLDAAADGKRGLIPVLTRFDRISIVT